MSDNLQESDGFARRLNKIEALEHELLSKASRLMSEGGSVFIVDMFVLGGIKRAIALSNGFRLLMQSRNFTCAASLLRMQIDTAARLYSLKYLGDLNGVR